MVVVLVADHDGFDVLYELLIKVAHAVGEPGDLGGPVRVGHPRADANRQVGDRAQPARQDGGGLLAREPRMPSLTRWAVLSRLGGQAQLSRKTGLIVRAAQLPASCRLPLRAVTVRDGGGR